MGTNCYIAVNEENGECILVDPAAWPPELSSHIRTGGMKPLAVPLKIHAGPAPKQQKKEKASAQHPQKQKGKQKQSSDDYRGTKK